LIHPKNWKSQNQFFPIQNGSKHLKKFSKIELFKKMLKNVWFIQKIETLKINFSHTKWDIKLSKIEFFKKYGIIMVIRVIENQQDLELLPSVELLDTGGIYYSSYWKIAGLAACYFQGNSWKLGVFIIRVIGK
jgi:hypothetical protein